MNIYERNKKVLNEKYPSLFEELEKEIESNKPQLVIEEKMALNGEPILMVQKDSKIVRLNSLYNPSHEARIWSEQYKQDNYEQIYILFGLGNGYSLRALRNQVKGKFCIIVYEPSYEIFHFSMEHYDFTDILDDPNILYVVNGINTFHFTRVISNVVQWNNALAQNLCVTNGYLQLFIKELDFVMEELRENYINVVSNRNTMVRFGKSAVFNSIENLKYIHTSNNVLEFQGEIPEDVPAIIVAAGPSLDQNVEQIKKAKGKAVIISVDRALDTLLAHNIMPDFSVTIDPEKPPRFYDNPVTWEIPLFCALSANRSIISRHKGRKIIFGSDALGDQFYKHLDQKFHKGAYGGSVATAGMTVALAMGIRNIILVGQDLAYKDGFTHAGGVKIPDSVEQSELVKVEGIHGEELYTGRDMYGYILWFQHAIVTLKDKIQVIDATEGGALIKGSKIMTLEDAIEEYCIGTFDGEKLLEKYTVLDVEKRYHVSLELLKEAITKLEEFYRGSSKAEKLCTDLIANIIKYSGLNNKGLQLSHQLSALNQIMVEMFIYPLVEVYAFDTSVIEMTEVNKMAKEEIYNQRQTFEMSRKLYEINKGACKEIIQYMKEFVEDFEKIIHIV